MSITVVIPTLNEEENIRDLLELLEQQTRIPDEIIVVDDGSTDGTVKFVTQYSYEHRNVSIIAGPHRGVNAARHTGTLYANTDIVVQTDADIVPELDWIERIENKFKDDDELIGLTGPVRDYKMRFFDELTTIFANFVFRGMGNNTAYRKEAYLKSGGYNEAIEINKGGDVIFWKELKKVGKCEYEPTLINGHKSGYKWRFVGITMSEVILVALGFVSRHFIKKFGDSLLGASAGLGLAEVGSVLVGVEEITNEEKINFTSIHHDVWGIIGLLTTLILDEANLVKNKEITSFLYGMFIAIVIHHFLTEVEGCAKGLCLNPKSKNGLLI